MNPPVKLCMLVMYEVPNVILSVKKEKHAQSIYEYLIQSRSVLWKCWRRQYEHANYYSWQNKEYVVIQRCHEALRHHPHCWPPVWLDLVLIEKRHPFSEEVQRSKRYAEEEIAGEGE